MADLSPILAELERFYDVLVREYVAPDEQDTLTKPIITIASKGKKRTRVGWYVPAVWSDHQEDALAALAGDMEAANQPRDEIVLASELLANPVETVSELQRQLAVHYRFSRLREDYTRRNAIARQREQMLGVSPGYQYDIPSLTPENTRILGPEGYYPRDWLRHADRWDHTADVLDEQPHRGWAAWKPKREFTDLVTRELDTNVFEVARKGEAPTEKRAGSRMKKWTCGCTTVRCATRLDAECETCGERFKWAEKSEANPYAKHTSKED